MNVKLKFIFIPQDGSFISLVYQYTTKWQQISLASRETRAIPINFKEANRHENKKIFPSSKINFKQNVFGNGSL